MQGVRVVWGVFVMCLEVVLGLARVLRVALNKESEGNFALGGLFLLLISPPLEGGRPGKGARDPA